MYHYSVQFSTSNVHHVHGKIYIFVIYLYACDLFIHLFVVVDIIIIAITAIIMIIIIINALLVQTCPVTVGKYTSAR